MKKIKEIVEQIKSSIPFLNKKNDGIDVKKNIEETNNLDEIADDLEASDTLDKNKTEDATAKNELSDADKERKKKIMIVVVLAIAFFLFGPEDEQEDDVKPTVTQNVNKNKNKKNIKDKPVTDTSSRYEKPKKNNVVDSNDSTLEDEFVIPDNPSVSNDEASVARVVPSKLSDLTNFENKKPKKTNNTTSETPFEKLPSVQDLNLREQTDGIGEDVNSNQKEMSTFDKISKKINEDFNKSKNIKVNYDSLGRGLAYNCKVGYWVCLNKKEYTNCRENLKWANKLGNKKECVPHDVYGGVKDCQIMQVHFINTSSRAGFCN
jgi:hypothetical protein